MLGRRGHGSVAFGPLLFVLAPWVFVLFARGKDSGVFLLKPFIAAALIAGLAAAIPLAAYLYEAKKPTMIPNQLPDWNYGSFGG